MVENKKTKAKKVGKDSASPEGYKDKLCPVYGKNKLKLRGRSFEGDVIRKFSNRVVITYDKMLKIPKYERYEKRTTKLHARLPEYMKDSVEVGDRIIISETRPISKMIHFVVEKIVRKLNDGENKNEGSK